MMTRLPLETSEKLKLLQGFFIWYYVFIIFNFTYIQAFLHGLFTGNENIGCVCLNIGVPGSLLRILAWTKFCHPYPLTYCSMRTHLYLNPLARFSLVGQSTKSLVMLILLHTCNHLKSLKLI